MIKMMPMQIVTQHNVYSNFMATGVGECRSYVAVEDKRSAAMRQLLILTGCEQMRDLDSDLRIVRLPFGQG